MHNANLYINHDVIRLLSLKIDYNFLVSTNITKNISMPLISQLYNELQKTFLLRQSSIDTLVIGTSNVRKATLLRELSDVH